MLSQEEIDSLLGNIAAGDEALAGDDLAGGVATMDLPAGGGYSGANNKDLTYKTYNFRRPDKFSKDHLRALQTIHEGFCRQFGMVLTTYLRTHVELDVVSVDQLTYEEFVRSMPAPMTVSILELQPLPGQALLGYGFEVTSAIIDRMLGGTGSADEMPRELTDIETSLIKRVIERTLTSLEEAWQSMMDVQFFLVDMEDSYNMIQVVTPGEIVSLVTFEVKIANQESGLMSLCIPYPMVEETIDQLSAQRIFRGQLAETNQTTQEKLLEKMHYAKVPVQVHLGGTKISVRDVLELRQGDVLQLDRLASDHMLMCINNKPKFYCRPGKLRKKLAVYVVEDVGNVEAVRGFGLD